MNDRQPPADSVVRHATMHRSFGLNSNDYRRCNATEITITTVTMPDITTKLTPEKGLSLLIVDDHPLYRNGLRVLFEELGYVKHVEEAASGKECLAILGQQLPDVVLLDINMPDMDGISCMQRIHERWPGLRVLAMSQHDEIHAVNAMLRLGIGGHLMKTYTAQQIVSSFEEILFHRQLVHDRFRRTDAADVLQKRELEVLRLLCRQLSSKQIAERLFISKHTVDNHRKRMLKKTGMQNTAGLVQWAIQNGVV